MKRFVILTALTLAGAAAAQQGETRHPPRMAATGEGVSPLVIGGLYQEKTPMLRSWVQGWGLTGSNPTAYEIRCDEVFSGCGMPIFRTRASAGQPYGMGSLTHSESAEAWRGLKVRLRAELRTGRVDGWAGLWIRIDGPDGQPLAFDNMQNRPLRGTSAFQTHEVVLQVPDTADRISFGVLLHGPGAVWIRELQFDEAPSTTATTDLLAPLRQGKPEVKTVETAPAQAPAPDVAKTP